MTKSEIERYISEKYEEWLCETYPDPKKRAMVRWIGDAAGKCSAHKLIHGVDPTEAEMIGYLRGDEVPAELRPTSAKDPK